MTKAVFITGTDTGVGKTIVIAWLTIQWGAEYWKPIQSGMSTSDSGGEGTDSQWVSRLSGCRVHPEAVLLQAPLPPHESARLKGSCIELPRLQTPSAGRLVIEGAGGLLNPINNTACMADLITQLATPLIIVARSGLGTINHTRLTVEAARHRGLTVMGVVMVGPFNPANRDAIEQFAKVPVLAELPLLPNLGRPGLQALSISNRFADALAAL